MSSAVRLPSELREFLALRGPQSLLVRGPPGSGKSTLCLALLEASPGERVLVTSRVSDSELHREFPWMGENGTHGIQVVDSSDTEAPFRGGMATATQSLLLDSGSSKETEAFAEFLLLPGPIQEAWSRLPADKPATVVIDSWDALVEHYLGLRSHKPAEPIDRAEIERMLLRRMGRSPCHLILVLEREEQTQLDYLVNGVVVTRREMNHDRLERWLLLPKLRGIRVAHSSYPYTVEGAKFQCIEPVGISSELSRRPFDPEPEPMARMLWPGSRTFAESFGRLPLGALSLLEADDDLPDQMLQYLVRPAIGSTLSRGGHVLLVPSGALSAEDIWRSVEGSVTTARLHESFRIVDVSREVGPSAIDGCADLVPSIISPSAVIPTLSNPEAQEGELTGWLKGSTPGGSPGLVVVYISGLESLAAALRVNITPEVAASFIAGIQATLGGSNLHMLTIGRTDSPLFKATRTLATKRIRVQQRQDRVFLYGSRPWTPGFVLTDASGSGPYDLLRIV
ncbi:MAG: hypothetical protein L3K17_09860 [Thermoplasmata archaeon]|nr:hypothetical protein [Thermoplasmata archaeon]